ncbi:MAG: PAS domain S-box protein, partial [Alphaproteobacteria bacterium]
MNKIKIIVYLNILIFTSFFFVIFSYIYVEKNNSILENVYQKISFEQKDIIYYDEILTMSAQMAAATGNPEWQKRYDLYLPKLGLSLRSVSGSIENKENILYSAMTNIANDRLVEMEEKAFNLVSKGHLREALDVLNSEEYLAQKNKYTDGINQLNKIIETSKNNIKKEIDNFNRLIIIIFFLEAFLAGIVLLISFRFFRSYSGQIEGMYKREKINYDSLYNAFAHSTILAKTDTEGNIVFANEKFCDISGYQLTELVGRNHRILKSGMHSNEFYQNLWQTIISKEVWHGEICNRRKNGEYYWVDCTIIPEINLDGIVTGFVSVRFDVTDKKDAERNLLINSKLITLGETTASVAHEIKTPLTVLKMTLSLLDKKNASGKFDIAKLPNEIENLQKMVTRIEKTIAGLTKYSRAGVDDLFEEVELKTVLDETLELCESKLKMNHVEIQLEIEPLVKLECRQTQISQVVLILINNSVDAI